MRRPEGPDHMPTSDPRRIALLVFLVVLLVGAVPARSGFVTFESGQVRPLALSRAAHPYDLLPRHPVVVASDDAETNRTHGVAGAQENPGREPVAK